MPGARSSTKALEKKGTPLQKKTYPSEADGKASANKGEKGSLARARNRARQEAANAKALKKNHLWQSLISSPRKWYGAHVATTTIDLELTKQKLLAMEHYKKNHGDDDQLRIALKHYKKQNYSKDIFLRPLGGLGPDMNDRVFAEKERLDKRRMFGQTVHEKNKPKPPKAPTPPTFEELQAKENKQIQEDEEIKKKAEMEAAAVKIQSLGRGHLARKRVKTIKSEKAAKQAALDLEKEKKEKSGGMFGKLFGKKKG